MAHGKLLTKKGTKVKEWTLSKPQLDRPLKETPLVRTKQLTDFLPKLDVPIEELRVLPERFVHKDLVLPESFYLRYFCRPKYRVRKNQKNLTPIEWNRFIYAIEAMADSDTPTPNFSEFVQIHIDAMDTHPGHAWGAHTMGGHNGRNFLTWHREYLAKLEARLIQINPLVTIPYWNWVEDRAIPPQLNNSADFTRWGITRGASFNDALLPTAAQLNTLMGVTPFTNFSSQLEASPFHNRVHNLVGGTMLSSASPADPIFWLHHCFIDKLFADWQVLHPAEVHPNAAEVLLPAPIMTRTNTQVWSITSLGYVYQS